MIEVGLLRVVLLLVPVLNPRRFLQRDRLILFHWRIPHQHAATVADVFVLVVRHVGVHVLQVVESRSVSQADDGDAHVERGEAQRLNDVTGNNGADSVGRAIGDVGDGVHGSVDGHVLFVDDEPKHGKQGRVDESDAEADDTDGDHEDEVVGAKGDEEASNAFECKSDSGQGPRPFRELLLKLDGQDDTKNVGEEGGQPDHALLPFGCIHGVVHPL